MKTEQERKHCPLWIQENTVQDPAGNSQILKLKYSGPIWGFTKTCNHPQSPPITQQPPPIIPNHPKYCHNHPQSPPITQNIVTITPITKNIVTITPITKNIVNHPKYCHNQSITQNIVTISENVVTDSSNHPNIITQTQQIWLTLFCENYYFTKKITNLCRKLLICEKNY